MDETTASTLDVLRLARRVASRWKLILLIFVAVAVPVTVWTLVFAPKRYEAKAAIFIEDPKKLGQQPSLLREWTPPTDAAFQIAILRSRSLAEKVVESLSSQATEELLGQSMNPDFILAAQNATRRLLGYELFVYTPQQRMLVELQQARVTFNARESGEVEINTVAYQPRVAMELANAYVEVLRARARSYTHDEARATREFIENFLNQTKGTLQDAEEGMRKFQSRRKGAITLSQRAGLDLAKLVQAEENLADVQANKEIAKNRLTYLKGGKDITGKPLPSGTKVTVQQLRDRLAQLEEKLASLQEKYTEQHPAVVATQSEIRQVQGNLNSIVQGSQDPKAAATPLKLGPTERAALNKQATDLEVEIANMEAKEETLKQRLNVLSQNLSSFSGEERESMDLSRKLETQRTLYAVLSERLGTAKIQEQAEARGLRVIDLAALPRSPDNSRAYKIILLGIAAGLGLGAGLATLLEYFNQPVETEDEVALLTDLPVLGWLPLVENTRGRSFRVDEPLSFIKSPSPRAFPAEGCRSIRTSLESLSRRRTLRTIMLASAGPREGKSTIVLNLGWAFWELGHRLIMIDSDLRRPSLHRALRLPSQPGLSDLLTAQASWDEVHRPIREDFIFLPAGATKLANPGAVLSRERLRAFLDLLKDRADFVLLDSAPVLAVSDNLILASMVDGVILVARSGHTQRRDLVRAKEQLDKVGAHLLGIVVNQIPPRVTRRYSHRYAEYYDHTAASSSGKSSWNPRSWWPGREAHDSGATARRESGNDS